MVAEPTATSFQAPACGAESEPVVSRVPGLPLASEYRPTTSLVAVAPVFTYNLMSVVVPDAVAV